jgi:hypothetical protein
VRIKKIDWLSQEALEAEVVVTDGEFEITCFAQPFNYQVGSELNDPILCYNVTNVLKLDREVYTIEKHGEYFAYSLAGKLVDKQLETVMVGKLLLELDNNILPGDINEGEFLSFSCQRLDII